MFFLYLGIKDDVSDVHSKYVCTIPLQNNFTVNNETCIHVGIEFYLPPI